MSVEDPSSRLHNPYGMSGDEAWDLRQLNGRPSWAVVRLFATGGIGACAVAATVLGAGSAHADIGGGFGDGSFGGGGDFGLGSDGLIIPQSSTPSFDLFSTAPVVSAPAPAPLDLAMVQAIDTAVWSPAPQVAPAPAPAPEVASSAVGPTVSDAALGQAIDVAAGLVSPVEGLLPVPAPAPAPAPAPEVVSPAVGPAASGAVVPDAVPVVSDQGLGQAVDAVTGAVPLLGEQPASTSDSALSLERPASGVSPSTGSSISAAEAAIAETLVGASSPVLLPVTPGTGTAAGLGGISSADPLRTVLGLPGTPTSDGGAQTTPPARTSTSLTDPSSGVTGTLTTSGTPDSNRSVAADLRYRDPSGSVPGNVGVTARLAGQPGGTPTGSAGGDINIGDPTKPGLWSAGSVAVQSNGTGTGKVLLGGRIGENGGLNATGSVSSEMSSNLNNTGEASSSTAGIRVNLTPTVALTGSSSFDNTTNGQRQPGETKVGFVYDSNATNWGPTTPSTPVAPSVDLPATPPSVITDISGQPLMVGDVIPPDAPGTWSDMSVRPGTSLGVVVDPASVPADPGSTSTGLMPSPSGVFDGSSVSSSAAQPADRTANPDVGPVTWSNTQVPLNAAIGASDPAFLPPNPADMVSPGRADAGAGSIIDPQSAGTPGSSGAADVALTVGVDGLIVASGSPSLLATSTVQPAQPVDDGVPVSPTAPTGVAAEELFPVFPEGTVLPSPDSASMEFSQQSGVRALPEGFDVTPEAVRQYQEDVLREFDRRDFGRFPPQTGIEDVDRTDTGNLGITPIPSELILDAPASGSSPTSQLPDSPDVPPSSGSASDADVLRSNDQAVLGSLAESGAESYSLMTPSRADSAYGPTFDQAASAAIDNATGVPPLLGDMLLQPMPPASDGTMSSNDRAAPGSLAELLTTGRGGDLGAGDQLLFTGGTTAFDSGVPTSAAAQTSVLPTPDDAGRPGSDGGGMLLADGRIAQDATAGGDTPARYDYVQGTGRQNIRLVGSQAGAQEGSVLREPLAAEPGGPRLERITLDAAREADGSFSALVPLNSSFNPAGTNTYTVPEGTPLVRVTGAFPGVPGSLRPTVTSAGGTVPDGRAPQVVTLPPRAEPGSEQNSLLVGSGGEGVRPGRLTIRPVKDRPDLKQVSVNPARELDGSVSALVPQGSAFNASGASTWVVPKDTALVRATASTAGVPGAPVPTTTEPTSLTDFPAPGGYATPEEPELPAAVRGILYSAPGALASREVLISSKTKNDPTLDRATAGRQVTPAVVSGFVRDFGMSGVKAPFDPNTPEGAWQNAAFSAGVNAVNSQGTQVLSRRVLNDPLTQRFGNGSEVRADVQFNEINPRTGQRRTDQSIQRISDGAVVGIGTALPFVQTAADQYLLNPNGLSKKDNYLANTAVKSGIQGGTVGTIATIANLIDTPLRGASQRILWPAFYYPAGQYAFSTVAVDALAKFMPPEVKHALEESCSNEDPVIAQLRSLACNGQRPTPPASGGTSGVVAPGVPSNPPVQPVDNAPRVEVGTATRSPEATFASPALRVGVPFGAGDVGWSSVAVQSPVAVQPASAVTQPSGGVMWSSRRATGGYTPPAAPAAPAAAAPAPAPATTGWSSQRVSRTYPLPARSAAAPVTAGFSSTLRAVAPADWVPGVNWAAAPGSVSTAVVGKPTAAAPAVIPVVRAPVVRAPVVRAVSTPAARSVTKPVRALRLVPVTEAGATSAAVDPVRQFTDFVGGAGKVLGENVVAPVGGVVESLVGGPVTVVPVDGDPLTHVGTTRYQASFLGGGTAVYDRESGKKLSGAGPATLPSWQMPVPPAAVLVPLGVAAQELVKGVGGLLQPQMP